ncbi:hypothetical protein D3C76_1182710 [compost metagenome]
MGFVQMYDVALSLGTVVKTLGQVCGMGGKAVQVGFMQVDGDPFVLRIVQGIGAVHFLRAEDNQIAGSQAVALVLHIEIDIPAEKKINLVSVVPVVKGPLIVGGHPVEIKKLPANRIVQKLMIFTHHGPS